MPVGGDFRERVRFERRSIIGDDGYGNRIDGWAALYGPVAARIDPGIGAEDVLSGRPVGVQPATITIRWSSAAAGIQPQDRVVDERLGRTWNVAGIANEDQRRGYLVIAASAGAADG